MFGAAGSLADASRAFETYRQVDALDTRVRAGVADATAAAKRTTDTLVASVSDAVATRDAGRSRASEKQMRQTRVEEKTGRRSRRDRGASSVRAWSVWCFHMGGESCADEAEGDEVRGTLVKPAERRAVFLYCDGDRGKHALVASAVLPAGMDAPEPGETMRVGPKAVRVVGEIHDFVVANSEESDDTHSEEDGMDTSSDLEDADEARGSASGAAAAAAAPASWWSWGSSAPAVEPAKPSTASDTPTEPAAEIRGGWFSGWFSAPEPAKPATPETGDAGVPTSFAPGTPNGDSPNGSSRGGPVDGALDVSGVAETLPERGDAPDANHAGPTKTSDENAHYVSSPTERKRSVVIPAPPPPPSLYAAAASWAPAPIAPEPTDLYRAREERAAGSMESMGSAGAVGFSYAFAAEAAVGAREHSGAQAGGGAEAAAYGGGGRPRGRRRSRNRKRRVASCPSCLLLATVSARKPLPKSPRSVRRRRGPRRRRCRRPRRLLRQPPARPRAPPRRPGSPRRSWKRCTRSGTGSRSSRDSCGKPEGSRREVRPHPSRVCDGFRLSPCERRGARKSAARRTRDDRHLETKFKKSHLPSLPAASSASAFPPATSPR